MSQNTVNTVGGTPVPPTKPPNSKVMIYVIAAVIVVAVVLIGRFIRIGMVNDVIAGSNNPVPVATQPAEPSEPSSTAPADLVAEYADTYPSTQEERFAIADSLPPLPSGFTAGSISDNGQHAANYVWDRWFAAYRYHDPRYLWGIVSDPATSPLYQKLKTLPAAYALQHAGGDADLELRPSQNLPVQDIGAVTATYMDDSSETFNDWVFRLVGNHWIVSIGPNSL